MSYRFTKACLLRQVKKNVGGLYHLKCYNPIASYVVKMVDKFKLALISYPKLRKLFLPTYTDMRNCPVPAYVGKSNKTKKRPCSRRRFCPYCWTKQACFSLASSLSKAIGKSFLPGYSLYYTQDVVRLPLDSSLAVLTSTGLAMFKKYRTSYLRKNGVSGLSECLVVHRRKKISSYVFILRRLVYCHSSSILAVGRRSTSKYGRPSVLFCAFPIGVILQGPVASMKLAYAFTNRRLTRKFGTFTE